MLSYVLFISDIRDSKLAINVSSPIFSHLTLELEKSKIRAAKNCDQQMGW